MTGIEGTEALDRSVEKQNSSSTSSLFSLPRCFLFHNSAVSVAVVLSCLLYARSHLLPAKSPPAAASAAAAVTEAAAARPQNKSLLPPPPPPPPPPHPVASFFNLPPVPALLPAPKSNPEAATIDLSALRGRVILAFNSASQCGFTRDNLRGLSALAQRLGPRGLTVLGFPCDAFGGQEPGGPFEIAA